MRTRPGWGGATLRHPFLASLAWIFACWIPSLSSNPWKLNVVYIWRHCQLSSNGKTSSCFTMLMSSRLLLITSCLGLWMCLSYSWWRTPLSSDEWSRPFQLKFSAFLSLAAACELLKSPLALGIIGGFATKCVIFSKWTNLGALAFSSVKWGW